MTGGPYSPQMMWFLYRRHRLTALVIAVVILGVGLGYLAAQLLN